MKTKLCLLAVLLSLVFNVPAQNTCAPKMVLMEQSCYKNCGPCFVHCRDDINPVYTSHIDSIAMVVYSQEPIGLGSWNDGNLPYSAFHTTFGLDYQSEVMMDRTFFPNNYHQQQGPTAEAVENVAVGYNTQMSSTYVPVAVNISNTYDATTRAVNITVDAQFCDTASGDMRIYLVLVQDTVQGPPGEQGYAQNVNTSASTIDGYNVVQFPNYAGYWAESFRFINAVKYQPSGFFGNAGIIPNQPAVGSTYSENFSFTLPVNNSPDELVPIDPDRIIIIAAVVRNGQFQQRQVINCNKKYLTAGPTNVPSPSISNTRFDATVINGDQLQLQYSSENTGEGQVNIYSASGQIVRTESSIAYNESPQTRMLDISNLSNGIYFVSMNMGNVFYTRKIILLK
jgi:hypothetical protein